MSGGPIRTLTTVQMAIRSTQSSRHRPLPSYASLFPAVEDKQGSDNKQGEVARLGRVPGEVALSFRAAEGSTANVGEDGSRGLLEEWEQHAEVVHVAEMLQLAHASFDERQQSEHIKGSVLRNDRNTEIRRRERTRAAAARGMLQSTWFGMSCNPVNSHLC